MAEHPLDRRTFRPAPLLFGIAFVLIGIFGLAAESRPLREAVWIWPLAAVALGAAGLVSIVLRLFNSEDH